jgi:hypothetical protein
MPGERGHYHGGNQLVADTVEWLTEANGKKNFPIFRHAEFR